MRSPQFVGRRTELDVAAAGLRAATEGVGQVVLISGEPGIGKTRLAQEIAAATEVTTCWSRAVQDDGSPPYWPFRQVLRVLVDQHPPGALTADLALVAPEVGSGSTRPITSPEERFRVFEAVTEYLVAAAGDSGLLIVLDDLHWADPPTLQLLVHLTRAVRDSCLMILATYRDTEIHGREAMSSAQASLAREESVTRIRLTGLTESEVAAQLSELTGLPVAQDVAATISRRTQGNPFFVAELGRLLHENGASLPDAVRDAVRARLQGLSLECRDVIAAASVLGSDLDPAVLAAVLDRPLDDVLAALDEAAIAGVTSATDGWRFAHDLVRDAARLDLPTTARLATHRRIAGYLEGRGDATTRVAEIAHHWLESLPSGDAAKAAEWAERAADAAMAQLAWESAADLSARAVAASADVTPGARARLLCRQGTAQLRQFDVVSAQSTLTLAATAAREAADANAIAEVALAMEGISSADWIVTGKALCDEALAALPADDNPLRARLLAQRAAETSFTGGPEMDSMSEDALAMAERTGDPQALRSALRARQLVRSGPDGVAERLALGDRLLAIGMADDDAEAVMWGRLWRFDAFCQLGRLDEAEGELLPVGGAAARMRSPVARWHHVRSQVAIAHARGNFKQARELAVTALDLVKATGGAVVVQVSVSMLATVTGMTGDDQQVREQHDDYLRDPPGIVAAMVGWWHVDCGRLDEARRCYQPSQVHEPVAGMRMLSVLAGLVAMAAAFDDRPTAAEAYRRLQPHGDLIICGGAGVVTLHGAVHGALGVAATTLGRLDDAVRHLRRAIEVNERAGLRPYAITARLSLARALARRRRPGDEAEAAALAVSVVAMAEQLDMKPVLAEARTLSATLSGDTAGPLSKREQEIAALVAQGLTNKQIAATVHISVRTVETHVQHILAKLGLATRTQIAAWAAATR